MNNTKASKKKMSTSKIGLYLTIAISVMLSVIFILLKIYTDKDLSDLANICEASFGVVGAYSAFYLWKSKTENRFKYSQMWYDQMAEKYGVENIGSALDKILGD